MSVTLSTPYSAMTKNQLWDEMEAWQRVINAPKGPGSPSNAERQAAENEYNLAGAWVQRILLSEGE
ncbi:hypothetical protein [Sulfitobacter pacificus]|uniref:hypothetical protein n=1 Tax=Sulfitobacter pacificus TaxID=1499314 RepID=UPI0031033D55